MGRTKINCAIKKLIEKSVSTNQRSIFFVYGKNSTEQVMLLHHLLASSRKSAGMDPPSVLWCFKKKLFTTFNEKRIKKLRKMYKGSSNAKPTKEDIFDHFIIGAGVQFCHYSESSRVLGQTFELLVLQDFSALTPNLLARTVECVAGAGAVLFLLPHDPSHLHALHMDAHERFVTEAFPKVTPRFNRRLLHSLPPNCLILDDQMQVRFLGPGFHQLLDQKSPPPKREHPASAPGEPGLRRLLPLCRTAGQQGALPSLWAALTTGGVASVTSARGRGKSALLGLALALGLREAGCRAVAVSSPHLDNLQTLFRFAVKGLEALDAKEGTDFTVERTPDDLVCGLRLGSAGRVRYLPPRECGGKWADLVVLDEAAAIPLPLVKQWLQSAERCVFLASTINGYEGTGRSLSLKLINQLRSQSARPDGTRLWEVELSEAVRYADGDGVEEWLDRLLCLHPPAEPPLEGPAPPPHQCQLYAVDRDLLFRGGESLLQRLVGLFVSSHYNNSPNDLLMLADAPAHALFCLMAPGGDTVLCAIQVAFEGEISAESCHLETTHGRRASGDMIPWVISQQFQDHSFTSLRGARVVRIATRPDCQGMGYGQHALDLLAQALSSEKKGEVRGRHLLTRVQDMPRAPLHYLGVSFGLTPQLFRFWKKCGFVPLYIRQTTSEVTGEHTCMMVKGIQLPCLSSFYSDFVPRFLELVATAFRSLPPALVLEIIRYDLLQPRSVSAEVCRWLFPQKSLLRLASFCNHQVELAAVADLLPSLARCHLMRSLPTSLPAFQESVLVSVCLQGKSVDACAEETGAADPGQAMGALSKGLLKLLNAIRRCMEKNGEAPKRSFEDKPQNIQRHKKFKNFH